MGTTGVGQGAIGQGAIGGPAAPGGGGGGGGGGGATVTNTKRNTAGDVARLAKFLAGDPNADYSSEAFVCTAIQIAQNSIVNRILTTPSISRLKFAVVIRVPAFTTDLRSFFSTQANGDRGPLELLTEIVSIREKPAGGDPAQYQQLEEKNDLPVRTQVAYNSDYVFTGDTILLPGATQALDMRIWGVFEPAAIDTYESPVIPNIISALTWATAAVLCEGHGNDAKLERLTAQAELEGFSLINNIMMEMQNEDSRQRPYGELSGTLE